MSPLDGTSSTSGDPRSAERSVTEQLRANTSALRLSVKSLGKRKAISPIQLAEAAEGFGAEPQFISGSKRLFDTSAPPLKAVTAIQSDAVSYWRSVSLPFPEPAIRLIRRDRIDQIDDQLRAYRTELRRRAAELEVEFDAIKADAQSRLGTLYNPADYPESVASAFDLVWSYPNVEAPDYLRELSPNLYQEQCNLARERFD